MKKRLGNASFKKLAWFPEAKRVGGSKSFSRRTRLKKQSPAIRINEGLEKRGGESQGGGEKTKYVSG